ncbi:polysaccharide deacetylase family protein [Pedobacter sp. HMF7647]|uniref:Polysaccharide deacetylase family protein n=1 Tax=Hufsiella arboris TaxID=2695275 RepID=A0A7K1Y924_9SPHI|nr:polysaccharide deacetylase family protein [Hufsiella arboris]MXV50871.1 polysaccharide deacetylase family protein [Hufsiella arboris]
MYLIKTPAFLRWLYPGLVWHKSREYKTIYLTFDDGPIPVVTPFVLKTLKKFNIKATFFCIGDNIRKHPEIFQAVINDGHRVGNHTFNHLRGWDTEDSVYLANVEQCNELTGSDLFRPPHGRAKKSQLSILKEDYSVIMWDVLSGDFDSQLNPEKCLKNVLSNTENGSIVVFHDSLKAFPRLEYALPKALEQWVDQGYEFDVL